MKKKAITALAISGLMTAGWAQEEAATAEGVDVRNTDPAISEEVASDNEIKTETGSEEEMNSSAYSGVIDSSELVSSEVYNMQKETIGSIDRILVNSESGQVEHAVVSVGGFLGIGDRLVAVPWSSFDIKQEAQMNETTTTSTDKAEEIDAEETDSEQLAGNSEADTEEAEDAAEEAEEETYENQAETETSAPVLHIYLNADEERLKNAPVFDPDSPNQLGNSSSTEYWNKDWSPKESEKMKKAPETTDIDSDTESTKVSSL